MILINKLGKKRFAFLLIAVLVIAGGGTYLLKHKNAETIKVTSTHSATSEKSKNKSPSDNSGDNSSVTSSTANQDATKNVPATTTKLEKPYGTFVSNHHPNLGGSPAPSSEQSDCHTAPGATCYIQFTKGTIVKKLPAEQADSSGIVSWNWDIKQAGLSTGSWTITAAASLNGKTMTAQDDLKLEVQP